MKWLLSLVLIGFSSLCHAQGWQLVPQASEEMVRRLPLYISEAEPKLTLTASQVSPPRVLASVHLVNGNIQCSSTVIGDKSDPEVLIITCRHCVQGHIGGWYTFHNPTGTPFQAQLIAVSDSADLSLFKAKSSDVIAAVKVAETWGPKVEQFNIGYPSGRGPRVKRISWGGDLGENTWGFQKLDNEYFGPGDSGGGVFAENDLMGVAWGYGGYPIDATKTSYIVDFVNTNAPKTLCRHWRRQCPPGGCQPPNTAPPPPSGGGWQPNPNVPIVPPPAPPPPGSNIPSPAPDPIVTLQNQVNSLEATVIALQNKPSVSGAPGPAGTNGTNGTNGKDGANGKDVDSTTLSTIQQQITALQGEAKNHGGSITSMQQQLQAMQNLSGHIKGVIMYDPATGQSQFVQGGSAPAAKKGK
jgi:hypothetical protein